MAKLNAVCHRPTEAITELRRALTLGASWPFLSKQDEFASLAGHPAYKALSRVKAR
jgi:hypothetical protein